MNFDCIRKFQDGLTEQGIAGNDCAIYLGYKEVYRHFSGHQSIEEKKKISTSTIFRMFSMTKVLTCVSALQLFEQGYFLLNDLLEDYLPEYSRMNVRLGQGEIREAKEKIHIQNLFDMTAGFSYDIKAPSIVNMMQEKNDSFTAGDFSQALAKEPLLFEPGSHWSYGFEHDVLGALIEKLTGKTLAEYMEENIFVPLGMRESWFKVPENENARICHRYQTDAQGDFVLGYEENAYQPGDRFYSGGAGLSMTVDDYAKFACALTNGGVGNNGKRILARRTVDLMRTNRLENELMKDYHVEATRDGYGYGLGVRTLCEPGASGSPSGIGEFGWGGAWGTYVLMDPANGVTIVYAEQGVDTKGPYIHRRLRNMAYTALEHEGIL